MSTFFDKLSRPNAPSTSTIDLTASKEGKRISRPVEAVSNEEAAPIEVLTETEPVHEDEEEEKAAEDEGELTVDIYNKGDTIVIQSTVAGVKPEHLDVAITDDTVTIRGRRERHDDVKEDNYYYKELFWGSFSRSVILPDEIEQEEAEAQLQHGLLTIRLPKKKHGITQKLKVKIV